MQLNNHKQIHIIREDLKQNITLTSERAKRFFKTGKGEYAEDDVFIGVTVPDLRSLAKQYYQTPIDVLQTLLDSGIHEERFLALIILTHQYKKADEGTKEAIYQFYLRNAKRANNWDLVDVSAHLIVGAHLMNKDKTILETLATSKNLWEKRISIVATWYFIRNDELTWTFKISKILLNDQEDLIQKAVGWMLREAGKKDKAKLSQFLNQYAAMMPRTMLRYAIEKFSASERKLYLALI